MVMLFGSERPLSDCMKEYATQVSVAGGNREPRKRTGPWPCDERIIFTSQRLPVPAGIAARGGRGSEVRDCLELRASLMSDLFLHIGVHPSQSGWHRPSSSLCVVAVGKSMDRRSDD